MKVAVFGNFGVSNLGDDLILAGFLERQKSELNEVIVFCGDPERVAKQRSVEAHAFFPSGVRSLLRFCRSALYREQMRKAYKALSSVEEVFIGGGGILVDHHVKAMALWWRQLQVIRKAKKPYTFIANSFELRKYWSQLLFLPSLRGAKKITVRDRSSLRFIQSHGLPATLVDDLACGILGGMRKTRSVRKKTIGLALCRWGLGQEHTLSIQRFLKERRREGYDIIGLAFQTREDDDREVIRAIDPSMPILTDASRIIDEIKNCELLIGMRYHSILMALQFGTPVLAIPYQGKVNYLLKDWKKEQWSLPLENLTFETLDTRFRAIILAQKA